MNLEDYSKKELGEELDKRKTIVPKKLDNPDWTQIVTVCEEYINCLANKGYASTDTDHFIFETVLTAVYGKDIWDFVNEIKK